MNKRKMEIESRINFSNSWSQDRYQLTEDEYNELELYAKGDPMVYGPAVYTARVMLGLETYWSEARKARPKQSLRPAHKEIIKVYPNPTSGNIIVEFLEKLPENSNIQIFSLTGKLILSQSLDSNPKKIDLSALKQGMYFYIILNNGFEFSNGKIVINR